MTIHTPSYFQWEHHAFSKPEELESNIQTEVDVIIAGAGPVGLTLALSLAQQGIKVIVLEARDCLSTNSRTLAVARRSVQILDRLGLAKRFQELAITRDRNYLFCGEKLIHSSPYEYSKSEKHPDISVLQQPWTEKILLDAVLSHPNVDLRWQSPVSNINLDAPELPCVTVSTQAGDYTLSASYLIAADGARGTVRRNLNLQYEEIAAGVVQRNFVICDFERKSSLPVARRLWINPPHRPDSTVILHKQPFDTWRLDFSLMPGETLEEAMQPDYVNTQIKKQLELLNDTTAEKEWKLVWVSAYKPMSRSLSNYRHGNVFFIGDAAHQTPIFGGRGMNQGMLDAVNLAWKLAFVVQGHSSFELLDTYDTERRPIIIQNLLDIAQATLCMTATTKGGALMRNAAIALLPTEPFVRRLIDAFNAHRSESLSAQNNHQPVFGAAVGYPLPDGPVSLAGVATQQYLHDFLQPHAINVLLFSNNGDYDEELLHIIENLKEQSLPCHLVCVGASPIGHTHICDIHGTTFEKLDINEGTCLIVRPDGYIGARLEQPSATSFLNALRYILKDKL